MDLRVRGFWATEQVREGFQADEDREINASEGTIGAREANSWADDETFVHRAKAEDVNGKLYPCGRVFTRLTPCQTVFA